MAAGEAYDRARVRELVGPCERFYVPTVDATLSARWGLVEAIAAALLDGDGLLDEADVDAIVLRFKTGGAIPL